MAPALALKLVQEQIRPKIRNSKTSCTSRVLFAVFVYLGMVHL